ncbi:MAG TPA: ABC transporter ATP-binding protein [Anaeromyxobacter sp.]|nr:ABC transporter ATP-binding protein [Anaeromyxobacter sp.]
MWPRLLSRLPRLPRRNRARPAMGDGGELLVPRRKRRGRPKIDVRQVGHRFQQLVALHDVNIEVHAGEFVCLLGPSGCGKTTLLYALAGLVEPSGGRISVDGVEVKGPGPERLLVFQEPALFPWLTVRQNLLFPLRARGFSREEAEGRARALIPLVHLEGFVDALPHQLSGGMRMRVQLGRALALDPAVLLMDEPFAALDAQTRSHMHQLLTRIWLRDRKTVVFVTHDVHEALVLGDRVVVMAARPGRVLQDLEVRLARPRDPDDEALVEMARRIRDELRRAEEAGAPAPDAERERREREEGNEHERVAPQDDRRGGSTPDLGVPL